MVKIKFSDFKKICTRKAIEENCISRKGKKPSARKFAIKMANIVSLKSWDAAQTRYNKGDIDTTIIVDVNAIRSLVEFKDEVTEDELKKLVTNCEYSSPIREIVYGDAIVKVFAQKYGNIIKNDFLKDICNEWGINPRTLIIMYRGGASLKEHALTGEYTYLVAPTPIALSQNFIAENFDEIDAMIGRTISKYISKKNIPANRDLIEDLKESAWYIVLKYGGKIETQDNVFGRLSGYINVCMPGILKAIRTGTNSVSSNSLVKEEIAEDRNAQLSDGVSTEDIALDNLSPEKIISSVLADVDVSSMSKEEIFALLEIKLGMSLEDILTLF